MAEDLLKVAKKVAQIYLQRGVIVNADKKEVEVKDIIVTFPDRAVYVNTKESELKDHIERNQLQYIIVMENGKAVPNNHTAYLSSHAAKIETVKDPNSLEVETDEDGKGKKKK